VADRTPRRWRGFLVVQLALLTVQLPLGMAVNFWVALSADHPGARNPNYFVGLVRGVSWAFLHGWPLLSLHITIAALLWLISIWFAIAALRGAPRRLGLLTIVAWSGLTGAAFNGGSFLNYGHDFSSLIMTLGWMLATASYAIAWAAPASGGPAVPGARPPADGG
jgi:hypothetical protein